jgi:methionine-S-sulfoxide reductase
VKDPGYEKVKSGKTGHAETVQIVFEPSKLTFEKLLLVFIRLHDLTTVNQQGNDVGTQYRSVIFFTSDAQKKTAEEVKARVQKAGHWKKPVVTEIVKASDVFDAEEYHQDYLQKNKTGYTCHFQRPFEFK